MTEHRTTLKAEKIDYKVLRKINPEAARLAVIEYLKTNKGNISEAARVLGIQRTVVYDILKKEKEGDLRDRSRAPLHSPDKTPVEIEDKVVEAKNQTHLGAKRLSVYLQKYKKIKVPYGTIRHILRRNNLNSPILLKAEKREFVDWYSAKPFQIVQVDLKFIRDRKALTKEQIIHLDYYGIPNYQWEAIDINSRFKLIAYSLDMTWTNGLIFYLWVISWLRSHGIREKIVFTVHHGEEWRGKTPYQHLKKQLPEVDSNIRFVIPIMLDKVSVEIGSWSGYNILAQHLL